MLLKENKSSPVNMNYCICPVDDNKMTPLIKLNKNA